MIRVMSFVTLTDQGARAIENFGDTVAKVRETVTGNGGTLEHAWQTAGIYDFVAVLNFPDVEAEFRSRNEVYKMTPPLVVTFVSDSRGDRPRRPQFVLTDVPPEYHYPPSS